MKLLLLLGVLLLAQAAAAQSAAVGGEHPLKLKQRDWQQVLEASRQGYLQRNRDASSQRQQQIDRELGQERRQQEQLFEQQRRERLTAPASPRGPARSEQDLRRMTRQQDARFKAQSDSLRLQQDIQRRANDSLLRR